MMFIDINCVYINLVCVFDFFRDLSDGCCKSKKCINNYYICNMLYNIYCWL